MMSRTCFEVSYILRYSAPTLRMIPHLSSDCGWGSRVKSQLGWVKDTHEGKSSSEEAWIKGSRTPSVFLMMPWEKLVQVKRTLTLVRGSLKHRCKKSGYTGYTCISTFTLTFLKIPLGYRPGWWGVEFWVTFFELLALATCGILN